jgi:hypothetical protein
MANDQYGPCRVLLTLIAMTMWSSADRAANPLPQDRGEEATPGCVGVGVRACVERAIDAMGGRSALDSVQGIRLDIIQNVTVAEQSYRQDPFQTSYDHLSRTISFGSSEVVEERRSWWPGNDLGDPADATLTIAGPHAAVVRADGRDSPGSRAMIDDATAALALGPERLLLTALNAPDLRYAPSETLRSTAHTSISFTWGGWPLRILLNGFNHLPDAVKADRVFHDFWAPWGDVAQEVDFDNWKLVGRLLYPTSRVEFRNGLMLTSSQVLDARLNPPIDGGLLSMDAAAAAKSAAGKGWDRVLDESGHVTVAPGIDLYKGSWNVSLIHQPGGVLVLEAPISTMFTASVLAKARAGGTPVRAVLSTSDSWPHVAGVREAVAEGVPIYVLDLNRPLLDRLARAAHSLVPDRQQASPMKPQWNLVSGKMLLGSGPTRAELYPMRGASTERQYMVYFPAFRLLYASDTIVYDPDKQTLYDPQLAHEVIQAVHREGLQVDTVYAMHQSPIPWSAIVHAEEVALGRSAPFTAP